MSRLLLFSIRQNFTAFHIQTHTQTSPRINTLEEEMHLNLCDTFKKQVVISQIEDDKTNRERERQELD